MSLNAINGKPSQSPLERGFNLTSRIFLLPGLRFQVLRSCFPFLRQFPVSPPVHTRPATGR